ncbi:GNAT family N-acetyltransferase [Saccharomonospora xinjiangensis]|uniref:GNAT family N-acetyltransferase n=1 Tax=Saccharomonospora xinjiangensis TaxID=75294 RepID=UPI00106F5A8D|nr:GNAT family N-acetyltransferase [Saccharomonospora xinjiangensis]QBQ61943.1 Acetyltransferase (GNAT) family protein [Saccharomonospora xinjiangensis]
MTSADVVTAQDLRLMQGLAQQVTATRPELINSDASLGELAWNWGRNHASDGESWRRRLWFSGDDLVAWGWAQLPRTVRFNDGSVKDVTDAYLAYQIHPDHAGLIDEVIEWYDATATNLEKSVSPSAADEFALSRWAAHGYDTDPGALGDTGSWTQLNERHLTDVERPELPHGFRFLTADEAGPEAAVKAHLDAWGRSTYTIEGYRGVRQTTPYRGDLHLLVEAPDGTMASSAIMWLDELNRTAEFEPVGTHPQYRRQGLARAILLRGMLLARDAGANHMTVACLGAPGHPAARELYYSVGFTELARDAPLVKPAGG